MRPDVILLAVAPEERTPGPDAAVKLALGQDVVLPVDVESDQLGGRVGLADDLLSPDAREHVANVPAGVVRVLRRRDVGLRVCCD